MLSIVNTLLSISLYEHNKIALDKSQIIIPELIDRLIERYYFMQHRNKTVKFITDYIISEPVYVDEVHLISIMENLIDNAIKFSSKSVEIHICCHIHEGRLYIKVKDNGYGISKKALPRIFKKFERCDAVNRNEAKGFGIGLNYVKKIVKAHGGNISVSSIEGKGSEFVVEIPVK